MSKTKYWLSSLVLDTTIFTIAAWWLLYDSTAAQNIFVFWNWVFSVLGFLSLTVKTARPIRPAGYKVYHAITEVVTISILVGTGFTFAAIARLSAAVMMEAAREHYKNAPAAQEGGAA